MTDSGKQNTEQEQAIAHVSGPMQVLAGPGSGKTYLTIRRIRHLIQVGGIAPEKILVITFTKAAAAEMKERFALLTAQAYPQVLFGTFHAVYYHILQTSTKRKLQIITEKEKRKLLRHVLMQYSCKEIGNEGFMTDLLKAIAMAKSKEQVKKEVSSFEELSEETFDHISRDYCRLMEEEGKLDFDDILIKCERLLADNAQVASYWQNTYTHILVDEFQDISPIQYRIIKCLASPRNNLFIVGDDDQSIYRFRGASPDLLLLFKEEYKEAVQLVLSVNYRCNGDIVKAAGLVIAENKNRFSKNITAMHQEGNGVRMKAFASKEEELSALLQELKLKKSAELEQTAVICRTNAEASYIGMLLKKETIPFRIREVFISPFKHPVVKDILSYLLCAKELMAGLEAAQLDTEPFLRIMNKPTRYISRGALSGSKITLASLQRFYEGNEAILENVNVLFADLERIAKLRPYTAIDYIRKRMGYDEYLKGECGNENWTDMKKSADELQAAARGERDLNDFLSFIAAFEQDSKQMNQTKNKEGAALLTMHASKGLEFDTVYLPDLNEGTIPSKKAVQEEEIEEERRMLYVAMTRAKKELHLWYVEGTKERGITPSRFLGPLLPKK